MDKNKYAGTPAVTITINDVDLNMYFSLFEEILLQLRDNDVVDVRGKDDLFIAYTRVLADFGLVEIPTSTMYPYCNYFPLKNMELYNELWGAYSQNKNRILREWEEEHNEQSPENDEQISENEVIE